MKKDEYIKDATKKIYKSSDYKSVSEELEGHIDQNSAFWESVDYDADTAEEKAVEAMGAPELVQSDFAEIHNDYYNPAFDIATLVLHLGVLFGGYYLIRQFVINDAGMLSTLLGSVTLAVSIMLGDVSLTLKRKKLVPALFSLLRTGATGAFLFNVFREIGKLTNSNIKTALVFFVKSELPTYSNYYKQTQILMLIGIISAVFLCGILISLSVWIKTQLRVNSMLDNRVRRKAVGVYRYFAVALLFVSVFFGVKQFIDFNVYKSEYIRAFETVQQMSETCKTADDVIDFVNRSDLHFKVINDSDGNITGYTYLSNITQIECDLTPEPAPSLAEALDAETAEMMNELLFAQGLPEDSRELFRVTLKVNKYLIKKGTTSFTLSQLWADERDEEYLSELTPFEASAEEQFDYYKNILPREFSFAVDDNPMREKICDFSFYIVSGDFSYEEKRTVLYYTPVYDEMNEQKEKLLGIIEKNNDLFPDELAKKTKAKEEIIDYTEIVKKFYKKLGAGSIADNVELKQARYVTKSGMFYILDKEKPPYKTVFFADTKHRYFDVGIVGLGDEGTEVTENTTSLVINGYHFDRYGKCYSEAEKVPFYTRDGRKYYFRSVTRKTNDTTIGDIKEKYYTDRHNSFYPESQCFVDEDGYIYFNTDGALKYDEKGYYKSKSGKKYIKATESSWYEDGTLAPPQRKSNLQKALTGD